MRCANVPVLIAALTMLALVACGGPSEPPEARTYVTAAQTSNGDEISVALARDGDSVIALACGDDPANDGSPGWFYGTTRLDGRFAIDHDGWLLGGRSTEEKAEGAFHQARGPSFDWSAPALVEGDKSGLYGARDRDEEGKLGAIVLEDSTGELTVRGAWYGKEGLVVQVTPAMPLSLEAGQLELEVAFPSGTRSFVAERVDQKPWFP